MIFRLLGLKEITFDFENQGLVVRKPVNADLGLKVNRGVNFSWIKMFSTACVLRACSLKLLRLNTEGQTIAKENLTEKLQN